MKKQPLVQPIKSFEDLRGLKAVGFIRDSTEDQRDGYGPDIQKHNEERFAESYGLALSDSFYTEFVRGRSMEKRHVFRQIIEDAKLDLFDVVLVDHTSRFGRNQEEAIRNKYELQKLGIIVIFVSQGIISGSDKDFLSERINETLDENYSRSLSRWVTSGLAEKAAQGHSIGSSPLGYRNEKSPSGRGAHQVTDPKTMPVLVAVLKGYSSANHSYRSLAQELNSRGFRTSDGRPFTKSSISTILDNRFYNGEVVYHRGQPDEEVFPGAHEVPEEIKELWTRCQEERRDKNTKGRFSPPARQQRIYPLTVVLKCDECGEPYHGEGHHQKGNISLRMMHSIRRCDMRPYSVPASKVEQEFAERVLGCIKLDDGWRSAVLRAMSNEGPEPDSSLDIRRVESAMANLRKQHLWDVIADDDFKAEYQALQRQLRTLEPKLSQRSIPNLDRAAELLQDLPALYEHPGVTQEQRRDLAREVFDEIRIREGKLVAVQPRPDYAPLFAYSIWKENQEVGGDRSS